ncbi:MAG: hypothetical protein U0M06_05100 [Clostridia bacterium]|nr:hypothetical protein [Clostridia bacterium]
MVRTLIHKIHQTLSVIKDFEAGYSSKTVGDGYMLIEYQGKRYAVKIVEIETPSESISKDIDRVQYWV